MPTKNLRVLHIIARFNKGGTARYLTGLICDLEAMQTGSLLAVGRVQDAEIEDSALSLLSISRVESLGRRISPLKDIKAYFELKKIVEEYKPSLIHTHTFKAGLLGRLLENRIPKIHTFHGHLLKDPEFSGFKKFIIILIEKYLARKSAALITVGQTVSDDLIAVGVGNRDQYVSIASEIDEVHFIDRSDARNKFGLHDDQLVILWMARLVGVKNPYLACEVAKLLPKATFLLAGGGYIYESLLQDAPTNVKVMGWQDPSEIIPAADIFLSTSTNEGIPYSILEAQAFGLPVVSVRAGAVEEAIIDMYTGFVTDSDAAQIAARIQSLIRDKDARLIMGERARLKSLESTGKKAKARAHLALYRRVLDSN